MTDLAARAGAIARRPWFPAALLALPFLGFAWRWRRFVLDDAWITFRFARNVADGHGARWNIDGDAVEGFTSMLWMLLQVPPHLMGVPIAPWAQALGLAAAMATVAIIVGVGIRSETQPLLYLGAAASMAWSPAFAFLAIQGMETPLAGLMLTLIAVAAYQVQQGNGLAWRWLAVSTFAAILTRPDSLFFVAPVYAFLLGANGDRWRRAMPSLAIAGLAGMTYMAARRAYFGHWFPNPFYVKQEAGLSWGGLWDVVSFAQVIAIPLAFLTLVAYRRDAPKLRLQAPIFAGIFGLLVYGLFMDPVQGQVWRFRAPLWPVMAVVIAMSGSRISFRPSAVLGWSVALVVVAVPFHYGISHAAYYDGLTEDRIAMGQALAPFGAEGMKMYTTESGALPYWSGWHSVDDLGLTDEWLAHGGSKSERLQSLDPDLIMLKMAVSGGPLSRQYPEVMAYADADYVLVGIVAKVGHASTGHVYLAKSGAGALAQSVASVEQEYPADLVMFCPLLVVDGLSDARCAT